MTPAAVAMFPFGVRGRVVAVLSVGGGLAMVAGVPAGTWLGQHSGWRSPFLALSALGLACLVAVAWLLPRGAGGRDAVAAGTTPNRRRYVLVLLTTVVSVTGMFFLHRQGPHEHLGSTSHNHLPHLIDRETA